MMYDSYCSRACSFEYSTVFSTKASSHVWDTQIGVIAWSSPIHNETLTTIFLIYSREYAFHSNSHISQRQTISVTVLMFNHNDLLSKLCLISIILCIIITLFRWYSQYGTSNYYTWLSWRVHERTLGLIHYFRYPWCLRILPIQTL